MRKADSDIIFQIIILSNATKVKECDVQAVISLTKYNLLTMKRVILAQYFLGVNKDYGRSYQPR